MGKHHATPLLLTAAAGLLTACTPGAWPLITGTVLLAALMLITLFASTDQRTPFERIVVLLCILRRIDPRPYLRLPEPARQKDAIPRHRARPGTPTDAALKSKPKTRGGEKLADRRRSVSR